jgi:hypothetical protein
MVSLKSQLPSGQDVTAPFDLRARINIRTPHGGRIAKAERIFFREGEKVDLTYDLSKFPDINTNSEMRIALDEIGMIEAEFSPENSGGQKYSYRWQFLIPQNRPKKPSPLLRHSHLTTVYLDKNYKPDYSDAETAFNGVLTFVEYEGGVTPYDEVEQGTFKFDEPVSFSYESMGVTYPVDNEEAAFDLILEDYSWPSFGLSRQGRLLRLSGLAEDPQAGVLGKKFSWTLGPDSGSAEYPKFLTTREQLASCVPYVEIGEDAILVKLINPNTGAAVDSSTVEGREIARILVYSGTGADSRFYTLDRQSIPVEGIRLPREGREGYGLRRSDITQVRVDLYPKISPEEKLDMRYRWVFRVPDVRGTVRNAGDTTPRKDIAVGIKDKDGRDVRKGAPFKTWLIKKSSTTRSARAMADETAVRESYGPFQTVTAENSELVLNVDNLINAGTREKERVPEGLYALKFESSDGTLAGMTDETVELAASGSGEKDGGGSSGGGCEVVYGFAFILLPLIGLVARRRS